MPAKSRPPVDLDEIIHFLQENLDKIMVDGVESIDLATYMKITQSIHNYCTAQKTTRTSDNRTERGAHLLGEDMYWWLWDYLKAHVQKLHAALQSKPEAEILDFYAQEWKRYNAAATYNSHVFSFLSRHWVKRELDEGKIEVYEIRDLHLHLWKKEILEQPYEQDRPVLTVLREFMEKCIDAKDAPVEDAKALGQSYVVVGVDKPEEVKLVRESFVAVGVDENE